MAYDRKKKYEQAKQVIEKHHLFFIEDVVSMLGVAKPTFYEMFPIDSNEMNEIKRLLETERVTMKVKLRAKLFSSKSDTGTLALYKLICTDEERKALSQTYQELTGKDGKDLIPDTKLTPDQRKARIEELKSKLNGNK